MRPNFFIIGAPKSGTTAMSEYLRAHSDIGFSTPKEPHFFATDMPLYRAVQNEAGYLALFGGAKRGGAVGEASVWYLYSDCAVANIREYAPDARIVVMLRNPVDMVYSMHSQHCFSLDEDELDFEAAWMLQDERRAGRKVPRRCRAPKNLLYGDIARYAEQLERVYASFPEDQVLVMLFDDFTKDNLRAYKEILEFLGVEYDGRVEFERINENKIHKSRVLAEAMRQPPGFVRRLNRFLKDRSMPSLDFLRRTVKRLNSRSCSRGPLSPELRKMIMRHYRDDVERLEGLLSRSLDHWKE